MRGKISQGLVYRYRQCGKLLKVLVVGRALLGVFPQVFNGVVIRRIRRQRIHGDPLAMALQKLLGRLAGVIPRPIVDQKQGCGGLLEDHLQERLVTVRVKPAFNALIAYRSLILKLPSKNWKFSF